VHFVLLGLFFWQNCDTLCTSVFVDGVMFATSHTTAN